MSCDPRPRLFLFAVSLISAGGLSYEVLLMRLFSIIQWQNFAYMMISLALLGYGASGTFLVLGRKLLSGREEIAFTASAFLFGLSSTGCFLAAQSIPFNALEVMWNPSQLGRLAGVYMLLIPPFFFAGSCIGLALQRFGGALARVYSADLIGGAVGSLGVVLLLSAVFPLPALGFVASLGLFASASAWLGFGFSPRGIALVPVALAPALWLVMGSGSFELKPVEYKALAQALQVAGASRLEEKSSPLGDLTVVKSPRIPFRHAPGMSLNSPGEIPEQLAVFTDGEGMSVINRFDGNDNALTFLDYLPSALPYHLLPIKPHVLVLGAGGGSEVLQALFHGAETIDAVELNRQMVDLVRRDHADFAGEIYSNPKLHVYVDEARGYVAGSSKRYDLIQMALLDAFGASSAGLHATNESYIYTVEAIEAYLSHLNPDGILAITRWVRLPPRDDVKLFATYIAALERKGVPYPGKRIAWIRGWQTDTLLAKNGPFNAEDAAKLQSFCEERSFDPVWYSGIREDETNIHNLIKQPFFYQSAIALLANDRRSFFDRYKFDVRPATDDRPYFFMFFKWPLLPELIEKRGSGGFSMLDMGYLTLVGALVQAVAFSLVLIMLPMAALDRGGARTNGHRERFRVGVYFFAIGFAFMFTEVVFIQRFILYLSHPLFAISVVLAGFLLFAGVGGKFAASIEAKDAKARVSWAAGIVALISTAYLILLPPFFAATISFPATVKIVIVLGLIAPVAFFMGLPFPLGLASLSTKLPGLVPWAWGVNGCASVIAAILAALLSIHFGQTLVLISAMILYGTAAWAFRP